MGQVFKVEFDSIKSNHGTLVFIVLDPDFSSNIPAVASALRRCAGVGITHLELVS